MLLTLASYSYRYGYVRQITVVTEIGLLQGRSQDLPLFRSILQPPHMLVKRYLDNRTDYTIKLSLRNFFKFVACIFSKNVI
jgi:hypothetical protein